MSITGTIIDIIVVGGCDDVVAIKVVDNLQRLGGSARTLEVT